jgi:hypothetical protein
MKGRHVPLKPISNAQVSQSKEKQHQTGGKLILDRLDGLHEHKANKYKARKDKDGT